MMETICSCFKSGDFTIGEIVKPSLGLSAREDTFVSYKLFYIFFYNIITNNAAGFSIILDELLT